MHKNTMKCNKTQSKWFINKHGASKIIDKFEMYQPPILQPALPICALSLEEDVLVHNSSE
jgi:hypothetical protein